MNHAAHPVPHRIRQRRSHRVLLATACTLLLTAGTSMTRPVQAAEAQSFHWEPGVAVNIPYALLDTDPTVSPVSVTYEGREERTIFDRRVDSNIKTNAFIFDVTWPGGNPTEFILNAEFGNKTAARAAVDKWVLQIGRLPYCLRTLVKTVRMHQSADWALGGGNSGLLIYSDRDTVNGDKQQEILVHEAAHNLAQQNDLQTSQTWQNLQQADTAQDVAGNGFISQYASDNPQREDVSESFLAWLALRAVPERLTQQDRDFITSTIPNRLNYFDSLGCLTTPVP
jgi:hypothetical protein